jgi:hypothetical protein
MIDLVLNFVFMLLIAYGVASVILDVYKVLAKHK